MIATMVPSHSPGKIRFSSTLAVELPSTERVDAEGSPLGRTKGTLTNVTSLRDVEEQ